MFLFSLILDELYHRIALDYRVSIAISQMEFLLRSERVTSDVSHMWGKSQATLLLRRVVSKQHQQQTQQRRKMRYARTCFWRFTGRSRQAVTCGRRGRRVQCRDLQQEPWCARKASVFAVPTVNRTAKRPVRTADPTMNRLTWTTVPSALRTSCTSSSRVSGHTRLGQERNTDRPLTPGSPGEVADICWNNHEDSRICRKTWCRRKQNRR